MASRLIKLINNNMIYEFSSIGLYVYKCKAIIIIIQLILLIDLKMKNIF